MGVVAVVYFDLLCGLSDLAQNCHPEFINQQALVKPEVPKPSQFLVLLVSQ